MAMTPTRRETDGSAADRALTDACDWLAGHPRLTTALVVAMILGAFWLEGRLP